METTLLRGAKDLEALKVDALTKRSNLKEYEAAYVAMRQAETDASLLGI